jgi:tyrosinase
MALNLRRSTKSIGQDENELKKLRNAFKISMGINDNRGYAHIAGFHGVPAWYCWHHQNLSRIITRGPFFLPWHRIYLYWLEIYLKELARDPTVTISYWDWSSKESRLEGLPKAYSEETINGDPNPLYKFHINVPSAGLDEDTSRDPGQLAELPTEQEITNIIQNNDFDDFLYDLEDVHDRMHGWVGGSMSNVGIASYDPIFFAHHCMIDRIWYLWQINHVPTKGFEQMLDIPLAPFNLNVNDAINIRSLGYDYAGDTRSILVANEMGE